MTIEKIRFLKPDVAVVIVRIIHKRPAEETESLATMVMTKDGDKWQIVSSQATRVQKRARGEVARPQTAPHASGGPAHERSPLCVLREPAPRGRPP